MFKIHKAQIFNRISNFYFQFRIAVKYLKFVLNLVLLIMKFSQP